MFVVCGLLRDYIRLETFSLGFFSWPGIAVRGVRSGKRHKQTLKTSAITLQHTMSRKEGKGHFLSSFSLYEFFKVPKQISLRLNGIELEFSLVSD
jgi:hypothetical protein